MMRLFINGLAASAGGGLTYLRNVIPELDKRLDVQATVLLSAGLRREFAHVKNISFVEGSDFSSPWRRFYHEQTVLPVMIQKSNSQVLISTGNFALWKSPVPQILLSRNSLYTSQDFARDVRARRDYKLWMDTLAKGWFARKSIERANVTVAPSEAFARELSAWSGKPVVAIPHGFDADGFTGNNSPLSVDTQRLLADGADALRLLFVSHYNYYRNFETLFRAIPILQQRLRENREQLAEKQSSLAENKVKLYLTCRLDSAENPGSYRAEAASSLASSLRAAHDIVELGTIPYRSLHHLYRACHIYVTPAYAESFGHPLVEAMSCGLPIVASDLPVHREICGDAALYFSRFSPQDLAERVLELYRVSELRERLSRNGLARAREFGWDKHLDRLLSLAGELAQGVAA
jgi:glycosyltransferase involved in cell wall biosynthesis